MSLSKITALSIFILLAGVQVRAGSLATTAMFGNGASCTGKGICSSNRAGAMPATFSYNAKSNTLVISFLAADLAKYQPDKVGDFQDQKSYTFDADWTSTPDISKGLGNTVTIKAGTPYAITATDAGFAITIPVSN